MNEDRHRVRDRAWVNMTEAAKRKLQKRINIDHLKNLFEPELCQHDFSDCGTFRSDCNILIARNKSDLAYVASYLQFTADYALQYFNTGNFDVTLTYERICQRLDGVLDGPSIGPMSRKDNALKFSKKDTLNLFIIEFLVYSLELVFLFEGRLPYPERLEEVINSEVTEEKGGFLSKLNFTGSGKKVVLRRAEPVGTLEALEMPTINVTEILNASRETGFNREDIEDISEKDAAFLAKFNDVEPELLPYYVSRIHNNPEPEQSLKFENSEALSIELRKYFPEEDMQDSLVQEALEKCDYMPEAAANWIVEQRKASVDLLCTKFTLLTKKRAAVIGEKCKYNKNMMLILANVDVMNQVERMDRIDDLPQFLTNITIPLDLRIEVAALELFGDLQLYEYDANIRAKRLIEMLSFEDETNRPDGEGWWDCFENYSFEDLVAFMCDVPDPSIPNLFQSTMLNNRCDICIDYYHKNKIIEFDCGCSSCAGCIFQRLRMASDGSNLEEAMQCPNSDCPQKDAQMTEEEKRNAFSLRYQRLCAFGMQFPEHREVFDKFVESYNRHAAILLANFTLCAHPPCRNGQVQGDPNNNCMVCHECKKKTCYKCKTQWFDEHKGMDCQEYSIWLRKNHPDIAGPSGDSDPFSYITCPECHAIFHLQRGGCLHFICRTCKRHFCGFCSRIFFNKEQPCTECEPSKQNSLHAHHPRNCYYYLRDEEVNWLIELLEAHDVNWQEKLPESKSESGKCAVMVTEDGENEEHECGKDPAKENFSFCERHFKEFLSIIIYENKAVDPIKKLGLNYLQIICRRENIEIPPNATEEILRDNISKLSPLDDDADP